MKSTAWACVATALHVSAAQAADDVGPTVSVGMSSTDISVGTGSIPGPGDFAIKPFPRTLATSPGGTDEADGTTGAALRREFDLRDGIDDVSLPEIVAAARNDPDQPDAHGDSGEAVNEWTDQLDSEALPSLAPPPNKQAPPEAPGRNPSGMGSQIVP
ncbi:MAG: hypothetical protein AB7O49_22025 [Sphingomonadales bacterium]